MAAHLITFERTRSQRGRRLHIAHCRCGWTAPPCKSTTRAWEIIRRQHPAVYQPPCPTPAKQRFGSRRDAELAMLEFWRSAGRGKHMPCRVYRCSCGSWHTTSKRAHQPRHTPGQEVTRGSSR